MNDPNQSSDQIPPQSAGFCQTCGRALNPETVRRVGTAVFCEPCLAARLHSSAPPDAAAGTTAASSGSSVPPGYKPVNTGVPPGYGAGQWSQTRPAQNAPNPGFAALLGLIPGVGAMYNEQYAKGLAHLLIFAVLMMFKEVSGFFGLFAFGWICYMSVEAHHTARARRDGTPLPNPFGLNDIGERMGFGANWPTQHDAVTADRETARDAARTAAQAMNAATGFHRPPIVTPPPAQTGVPPTPPWGAPTDAYQAPPTPYASYTDVPHASTTAVPPYPSSVPYQGPVYSHPTASQASKFPVGAIWLIAIGAFFLFSTLGLTHVIISTAFIGVVLIGLGAWVFLRTMLSTGLSLAYDGTPGYALRLIRAARGAVWLVMIGLLSILHGFHMVSWGFSWPALLIVAGILMLVERLAMNAAAASQPMPPMPNPIVPPAPHPFDQTPSGGL